jgi:CheY-like chemotaxis protein
VVDARLEVLHPEPAAPAEPPAATVSEPPAAGPAPAPESAVHAVEAPGSSVDAPAARAAPVPKPARRRALVADDSLVARIFLARLLEKRGWIVELVGDAASLWAELAHGPWGLVCADIALPDAPGSAHVTQLVDRFRGNPAAPWLVVLTRDAQDEREARGAGAAFVLRKPFEPERLDAILPR